MPECPRLPGAECADATDVCCLALPSDPQPFDVHEGLQERLTERHYRECVGCQSCYADLIGEDDLLDEPVPVVEIDLMEHLTTEDLLKELLARIDHECGDLSKEHYLVVVVQDLYEDR